MPTPIRMPRLGMTMTEGRVVAWPVPLGERVDKGQIVLVIESEKAEVEIEATAGGHLRHVYVEVDATVPCGTLLAALTDAPDEAFDADAFRRENDLAEPEPTGPAAAAPTPKAAASRAFTGRGTPVTPAARALARKLGLDPGRIAGTGPGGRVTRQDVEALAARREALAEASGGVRLEVPSRGEGAPVMLLPGFGSDASSFAFQAEALAGGYRVMAVNPRGVGASDAPESDVYDLAGAAADVAALAPAPAHLVGASLGAAVALEVALRHRDRVRSLVLVTPFLEAGARLESVLEAWCRVAREATPETLARALLPWLFSERFLADAGRRERTVRGLAASAARIPAATLARTAAGLRAWSGTRRGALADLDVPTRVVVAGGDLLATDGEAVARALPGAALRVVPEAGHAVAIEAPEAVNEAILEHLAAAS